MEGTGGGVFGGDGVWLFELASARGVRGLGGDPRVFLRSLVVRDPSISLSITPRESRP